MINTFPMEISMELVSLYPFDPTGRSPDNRIENESITVIPPSEIKDYSYVIPRAAPFYADTLVLRNGQGPGSRRLIENVDYWCVIDFLSASHSLQRRVSVGIALLDARYSGTLYATYQAVGGNYTLADYSILEELIRARYIVKHVSYEQIINLPEGFAPEWHRHQVADMVGMKEVVTMLGSISEALSEKNGTLGQLHVTFDDHINKDTSHTPMQVGLSNVKNYAVATLADVQQGRTTRYVTADILKKYVDGDTSTVQTFNLLAGSRSISDSPKTVYSYTNTSTTVVTYSGQTINVEWYLRYIPMTGVLDIRANVPSSFNMDGVHPMLMRCVLSKNGGAEQTRTMTVVSFNASSKSPVPDAGHSVTLVKPDLTLSADALEFSIEVDSSSTGMTPFDKLTIYISTTISSLTEHETIMDYFSGVEPWSIN